MLDLHFLAMMARDRLLAELEAQQARGDLDECENTAHALVHLCGPGLSFHAARAALLLAAILHVVRGEHGAARTAYQRALGAMPPMSERSAIMDRLDRAHVLLRFARLLTVELHDHSAARPCFEEALALLRDVSVTDARIYGVLETRAAARIGLARLLELRLCDADAASSVLHGPSQIETGDNDEPRRKQRATAEDRWLRLWREHHGHRTRPRPPPRLTRQQHARKFPTPLLDAVWFEDHGLCAAAAACYREALALPPHEQDRAHAHYEFGTMLATCAGLHPDGEPCAPDVASARAHLEAALAIDSGLGAAHMRLAWLLRDTDHAAAQTHLAAVLAIRPDHVPALQLMRGGA